jgi:phosphoribosyl 1,2-cyclic phosphate phosphodiesterase
MKVTILGCGAAGGVPMISVGWGRCDPANPKNRRRRPSILVETEGQAILIDTGPDLREQLLSVNINMLDAVLYTHAHADHVHGIDDLREVNRAMRRSLDVYGSAATLAEISERFGYVFTPLDIETMPIFKPWLVPHAVEGAFKVGPVDVLAIDQDHGYCRSTGFRIGNMAYSTDAWDFPEASLAALEGLDLWIIGCLLDTPHETHAHVDKVLGWVERLKPKRTLLTHMSPRLDYAALRESLPAGVEPAYDGLTITL